MEFLSNQERPRSVRDKIFQRIHTGLPAPSDERVYALRDLAGEELRRGYSREALLEDFEAIRSQLEEQGNDAEDDVVMVMDALSGFCSPGAKL